VTTPRACAEDIGDFISSFVGTIKKHIAVRTVWIARILGAVSVKRTDSFHRSADCNVGHQHRMWPAATAVFFVQRWLSIVAQAL